MIVLLLGGRDIFLIFSEVMVVNLSFFEGAIEN